MADGQETGADTPRPGAGPVGAVDCGTNSTRLLIAGTDGVPLERRMVITRTGDGVDRNRRLSPEAMERTLSVLADYGALMDRYGVGRRRAVATSAARDASNREEFFDRATRVLGVRPELLSGSEEGLLSFAGATAGLGDPAGPVLVVDIGGGSTELVLGSADEVRAVSLDVGCVRISERFLASDPPAPAELEAARRHVDSQLERVEAELGAVGSARILIGLAGTVSTAAMMDAGLSTYRRQDVHHRRLHRDRVEALLGSLSVMDHGGRAQVPGLEPGRVDVIVGGLLVLVRVMDVLGFEECLVSESDILDGMAAELQAGG